MINIFNKPLNISSLSCLNENMGIDTGGNMRENSLRAVIAAWLNYSQRSRVGSAESGQTVLLKAVRRTGYRYMQEHTYTCYTV